MKVTKFYIVLGLMNLATFQQAAKFWIFIQCVNKNLVIEGCYRSMKKDNRLLKLLKFLQLVVAVTRGSSTFLAGLANNI